MKLSTLLKIALSTSITVGAVANTFADVGSTKSGDYTRNFSVKAELATGPNKFLDGPIRDHGVVFGFPFGTLGFAELGEYNPGAALANPLTKDTPDEAILATFMDPLFIQLLGFDPSDIDSTFLNVPLNEVATATRVATPQGPVVVTKKLPGMFDSPPFEANIAAPHGPITLGQWKQANGRANIQCIGNDYATVELRMKNLVPNRSYTIWSGNMNSVTVTFNQPLGGAPSAVTSDEDGKARFFRELNFCPLDIVDNADGSQSQMLFIMVLFHSDHHTYGGIFAPNSDSRFGGTVAHVQLHFPIVGEKVE